MSHDTNHEKSKEIKSIISSKNSFWLVVIIVGLFVAALNFVQAESGRSEGESAQTTEANAGGAATGENNAQQAVEAPKAAAGTQDTTTSAK